MAVAPDRWVLKAAVAPHLQIGMSFRTTNDVDLGRWDNERAATDDFVAAERLDLGDYCQFAVERTAKLDKLLEGAAVRYHVSLYLAGRRFEEISVDVGFGEPPTVGPDRLHSPNLLSFAEIQPTEVPALPLASHVAEKVHAYTRGYAGGRPSTRVKDLVDLVLISMHLSLQAGTLRRALQETFDARRSQMLPIALPPPPVDWRTGYRRMASEVGVDSDLSSAFGQARSFLDPILDGTVTDDGRWDPPRRTW